MRRKAISLRVFSKMTRGSSLTQRRMLGAMTMAKLEASIFVANAFSARMNTWDQAQRPAETGEGSREGVPGGSV